MFSRGKTRYPWAIDKEAPSAPKPPPAPVQPPLHCELCGASNPDFKCEDCGGQLFCASCDGMYHRHPRRNFHSRKELDNPPPVPPRPPNKDLFSRFPLAPPRRRKKSVPSSPTSSKKEFDFQPALPKKEFLGSLKRLVGRPPVAKEAGPPQNRAPVWSNHGDPGPVPPPYPSNEAARRPQMSMNGSVSGASVRRNDSLTSSGNYTNFKDPMRNMQRLSSDMDDNMDSRSRAESFRSNNQSGFDWNDEVPPYKPPPPPVQPDWNQPSKRPQYHLPNKAAPVNYNGRSVGNLAYLNQQSQQQNQEYHQSRENYNHGYFNRNSADEERRDGTLRHHTSVCDLTGVVNHPMQYPGYSLNQAHSVANLNGPPPNDCSCSEQNSRQWNGLGWVNPNCSMHGTHAQFGLSTMKRTPSNMSVNYTPMGGENGMMYPGPMYPIPGHPHPMGYMQPTPHLPPPHPMMGLMYPGQHPLMRLPHMGSMGVLPNNTQQPKKSEDESETKRVPSRAASRGKKASSESSEEAPQSPMNNCRRERRVDPAHAKRMQSPGARSVGSRGTREGRMRKTRSVGSSLNQEDDDFMERRSVAAVGYTSRTRRQRSASRRSAAAVYDSSEEEQEAAQQQENNNSNNIYLSHSESEDDDQKKSTGDYGKAQAPSKPWQCVFCTFINDADTRICGMCSKTFRGGLDLNSDPNDDRGERKKPHRGVDGTRRRRHFRRMNSGASAESGASRNRARSPDASSPLLSSPQSPDDEPMQNGQDHRRNKGQKSPPAYASTRPKRKSLTEAARELSEDIGRGHFGSTNYRKDNPSPNKSQSTHSSRKDEAEYEDMPFPEELANQMTSAVTISNAKTSQQADSRLEQPTATYLTDELLPFENAEENQTEEAIMVSEEIAEIPEDSVLEPSKPEEVAAISLNEQSVAVGGSDDTATKKVVSTGTSPPPQSISTQTVGEADRWGSTQNKERYRSPSRDDPEPRGRRLSLTRNNKDWNLDHDDDPRDRRDRGHNWDHHHHHHRYYRDHPDYYWSPDDEEEEYARRYRRHSSWDRECNRNSVDREENNRGTNKRRNGSARDRDRKRFGPQPKRFASSISLKATQHDDDSDFLPPPPSPLMHNTPSPVIKRAASLHSMQFVGTSNQQQDWQQAPPADWELRRSSSRGSLQGFPPPPPALTPEMIQQTKTYAGVQGFLRKSGGAQDYIVGLDELLEHHRQEAMRNQGTELFKLLKEAEESGYTSEDLQVAMTMCSSNQHPVQWLKDNWQPMIETVVSLTSNYGKDKKDANDRSVGPVSSQEACHFIRLNKGNVWAAVTQLVELRQKQIDYIMGKGSFTRSDATDALSHQKGDVEAALNELNLATTKPFVLEVWGPPSGVDNESGSVWPVQQQREEEESNRKKTEQNEVLQVSMAGLEAALNDMLQDLVSTDATSQRPEEAAWKIRTNSENIGISKSTESSSQHSADAAWERSFNSEVTSSKTTEATSPRSTEAGRKRIFNSDEVGSSTLTEAKISAEVPHERSSNSEEVSSSKTTEATSPRSTEAERKRTFNSVEVGSSQSTDVKSQHSAETGSSKFIEVQSAKVEERNQQEDQRSETKASQQKTIPFSENTLPKEEQIKEQFVTKEQNFQNIPEGIEKVEESRTSDSKPSVSQEVKEIVSKAALSGNMDDVRREIDEIRRQMEELQLELEGEYEPLPEEDQEGGHEEEFQFIDEDQNSIENEYSDEYHSEEDDPYQEHDADGQIYQNGMDDNEGYQLEEAVFHENQVEYTENVGERPLEDQLEEDSQGSAEVKVGIDQLLPGEDEEGATTEEEEFSYGDEHHAEFYDYDEGEMGEDEYDGTLDTYEESSPFPDDHQISGNDFEPLLPAVVTAKLSLGSPDQSVRTVALETSLSPISPMLRKRTKVKRRTLRRRPVPDDSEDDTISLTSGSMTLPRRAQRMQRLREAASASPGPRPITPNVPIQMPTGEWIMDVTLRNMEIIKRVASETSLRAVSSEALHQSSAPVESAANMKSDLLSDGVAPVDSEKKVDALLIDERNHNEAFPKEEEIANIGSDVTQAKTREEIELTETMKTPEDVSSSSKDTVGVAQTSDRENIDLIHPEQEAEEVSSSHNYAISVNDQQSSKSSAVSTTEGTLEESTFPADASLNGSKGLNPQLPICHESAPTVTSVKAPVDEENETELMPVCTPVVEPKNAPNVLRISAEQMTATNVQRDLPENATASNTGVVPDVIVAKAFQHESKVNDREVLPVAEGQEIASLFERTTASEDSNALTLEVEVIPELVKHLTSNETDARELTPTAIANNNIADYVQSAPQSSTQHTGSETGSQPAEDSSTKKPKENVSKLPVRMQNGSSKPADPAKKPQGKPSSSVKRNMDNASLSKPATKSFLPKRTPNSKAQSLLQRFEALSKEPPKPTLIRRRSSVGVDVTKTPEPTTEKSKAETPEAKVAETSKEQSTSNTSTKKKVPIPPGLYVRPESPSQMEFERKVRKLLAEGRVSTYEQGELAAKLMDLHFPEDEALGAAKECSDLYMAVSFLQQECELCAARCQMGNMASMLNCTHRCCLSCARQYFTVQIKGRSISDCVCPFCGEPDLADEDVASDYFNHLDIWLKSIVDKETHELFQSKLRDRTLMSDPHFRWCSQCSSGFIVIDDNPKVVVCPDCKAVTCALCKKLWERQHESLNCDEFSDWKATNDPDPQADHLAKTLAESGIECPNCKFRYLLAKGGCMHFKCTQCKYDFCSGCGKSFKMGQKCGISPNCGKLGLHAHHPRNCLFYLRDKEPKDLQKLLKEFEIEFDTEPPDGKQTEKCPVLEQRETPTGLIDTVCGNDVPPSHAGLCRIHYVEYLGTLVSKQKIDPVSIFDEDELTAILRRFNRRLPVKCYGQHPILYKYSLLKIIQDEIPLDEEPQLVEASEQITQCDTGWIPPETTTTT